VSPAARRASWHRASCTAAAERRQRLAAEARRCTYLGDSVYAAVEGGMVVLTTEDGSGPALATNRIYLEPEVMAALLRWHLGTEEYETAAAREVST